MKRNRTASTMRIGENHIFYICLLLVLAIAAIGLVSEIVSGR